MTNQALRSLVIAMAVCAFKPVGAQDLRAVEMLKEKGFTKCAHAVANMTDFFYDKSTFRFLNVWNVKDANGHMATTTTVKPYSDGMTLGMFSTAPVASGGCDVGFTQLFLAQDSCAKLRDTTFKDWKYYSDALGVAAYEDPTSPNVVVILLPNKESCIIAKTGILFFGPQ